MSAAKHTLNTPLTAVTENAVFCVLLNIFTSLSIHFSAERRRTVDVFLCEPVPLFDCPMMCSWSHLYFKVLQDLGEETACSTSVEVWQVEKKKETETGQKGGKGMTEICSETFLHQKKLGFLSQVKMLLWTCYSNRVNWKMLDLYEIKADLHGWFLCWEHQQKLFSL